MSRAQVDAIKQGCLYALDQDAEAWTRVGMEGWGALADTHHPFAWSHDGYTLVVPR